MGLGKLKSAQSLSQKQSTSVPGTPAYIPPECLVGKEKATIRLDCCQSESTPGLLKI